MRCSGCGKDIPFAGEVCPHCQRDKSGDQKTQVFAMLYGFIGGAIGYFISGVGLAFIGLFIGAIVGTIIASKGKSNKTQPPKVQIVENSEPMNSNQELTNIDTRLSKLETLKSKGLISEYEYKLKRQEIIDTI